MLLHEWWPWPWPSERRQANECGEALYTNILPETYLAHAHAPWCTAACKGVCVWGGEHACTGSRAAGSCCNNGVHACTKEL